MAKFKSCQISMALTHVGITATTFTNSSLVWGQYKFMIKMLKANGNGNILGEKDIRTERGNWKTATTKKYEWRDRAR